MGDDGGQTNHELLCVTVLPDCVTDVSLVTYDAAGLEEIYLDASFNGFSFIIIPAMSEAHLSFADSMAIHMTDNIPDAISTTSVLADIRTAQGRLNDAVSIYRRSLHLAASQRALPGRPPGRFRRLFGSS